MTDASIAAQVLRQIADTPTGGLILAEAVEAAMCTHETLGDRLEPFELRCIARTILHAIADKLDEPEGL